MSSSGPIRKLPVELLRDIVERLRDANKLASLAALGQTCRGFREIIDHYLWHHPQAEEPEVFYWGCRYGREAVVRRLLALNDGPPTGNRIRELNHGLGLPHTWVMTPNTAKYFLPSSQEVVKPRKLFLSNVDLDDEEQPRTERTAYPIHLAILSGNAELVKYITLRLNGPLEWHDQTSNRLCHCVIDGPGIRWTLNQGDATWPSLNALHMALCIGHEDIINFFFKLLPEMDCPLRSTYYVELTVKDAPTHARAVKTRCSPTHLLARNRHLKLLDSILNRNDKVNYLVENLEEQCLTPIWHAYLKDHWDIVDRLLQAGADIDDDLSRGYTPLIHAAIAGNLSAVKELLDRGANVNTTTIARPPQRMFAWNPNHTSYYGLRALDICLASSPNQGKISFRILKRRTKEASTMWKPPGRTAAQKEVEYRGYEHQRFMLVQRLVQAGANLNASMISVHKTPPLVAAAAEHLPDIVDYLLDRGSSVNEPDAHGITALVATLGYGHCSCPFHIFPPGTKRPRNQPICRGLQKCVTLLLDSGAQISPVGSDSALLRLAIPSRYRRSAESKGRVTQVGMRRDWYLAEEDKENLAHMFMSRHANPSLISGSMRIPTISSIEKNMPYLASDSTVVLNPLPQHYESWLLCKQSPVATPTRPAETWPWSPLQHAFWSRDFSLFEILMSYGNVPPAADILWMFQGMIYSLMISPVEIFCHFRRTDWLNLLALSPGQPQFRALRSPIALAWTLALLRECALSPVKILETDDFNCLCYSGTDAPSHDLRGSCKGLKQRDVSQLAWDFWSLEINRDHLLEMVDARRWHPCYGSHRIMVATVCLEEAVLAAELRIVSALLDLNIEGIIRPEILIMAVSLTKANHVSSAILEKLLQKSTPLPCRPVPTNPRLESPTGLLQHATCKPKDKNTNLGGLAGHRGYPHCRDPLQYAICTSNLPALTIFSCHPLPCPVTTLYINEATLRLDVQVLSLLLIRNPACRSEDPLIFLLKNLHDICNGVVDLRYHHVAGTSHLGVSFSQLTRRMACAVALIRTGVDLDRAVDERGKSARGYIDEYQGYQGPNRFLREVARRGARLLA